MEAALHRMADDGFVVDAEITERVGETFVRDPNGILINLNEVD
jgi:catechol 2,3-dioxygenase-like lactoylglutathione lyase family enzyme